MLLATQTPKHHHLAEDENENGDDDDMNNGDNGSGGGDVSRDLDTDEHIKDPVEDRRTLAERNERLHDQLKVSYLVTSTHDHDVIYRYPFLGLEARFGSLA